MLHKIIIKRNKFMYDLMPTLIGYCPTVRRIIIIIILTPQYRCKVFTARR